MVKSSYTYQSDYFANIQSGSLQSARAVVPIVMDLFQPTSVIDVGCGTGTWLTCFREYGVQTIQGVDGSYVKKELLLIPSEHFNEFDLRSRFHWSENFDLVVSLEVAEHLPPECQETFVETLTDLGPVILFSAAIPFQGGGMHLNEQFQSFWAGLFRARSYVPIDCIRRRIWDNTNVDYWYRQNCILYVRKNLLNNHPKLRMEYENAHETQLATTGYWKCQI